MYEGKCKKIDTEEYWQNRLEDTYDLDGVGYAGLSRSYNKWLYRVRRRRFWQIIGNYNLSVRPYVLDVGSGTGFYIDLWQEVGAEKIVGTDIAEVAVEELRNRYPNHTFLKGDISSNEITKKIEKSVDVVSAMDVLFHIVEDKRYKDALSNIFDVMRSGGFFFFSGNFLHKERRSSQHIVHRTLRETRRALREAGFVIVDRHPVFMVMNEPIDSPSAVNQKLWSRIYRGASHSEAAGAVLGACLFPIEMVLTRVLAESPTTEMMVCKKPDK